MNGPTREPCSTPSCHPCKGRGPSSFGLFFEYLCFCLPPMTFLIKRLWLINKIWRIPYVCSLIPCPYPERFIGIKIKSGIILLVLQKELFEGVRESIKAHAKGNEEEFGEALVVFSLESLTAFKEPDGNLFESWNGIFMTIYTSDGSFFEDTYLFEKGNLRSILLAKMIKLFGILEGFGIVFFLWFP